ncbi:uncharacterized protein YjbI with pentapeptide repeats [Natronocella acetinitrilica]|uniref:Uncharacterized protein YjbI with pentapeptide repeats n=1 Tax=Natronocella acetinitrilica TaxID=414046 RepID=A0AAE3KA92_9GAMM|nr:uncharacterized protein YjbI with pentapeptide repeats [Natronocella acetinitrilica]
MEVVNRTPFTVAPIPGRFGFPGHSRTFVVKATLALVHRGVATVLEEQPFPTGDVAYDDDPDGLSAPRYETDFAPYKPLADVLLVGHCHTPGGEPAQRCPVRLEVGQRRIELAVTGDRYWQHGLAGGIVSDPRPFTQMPLRYERAFGGPEDSRNPVGVGFGAERVLDQGDRRLLLPNIEFADRLIRAPADNPGPAGLGPLARAWSGRSHRQGTYDARWEAERWPWYPDDFDWRYWNAAPVAFSDGYLDGTESISLFHLHPSYPEYTSRLPDLRVRLFVERRDAKDAALDEVEMRLDTLWIDADAEKAVLVWRGVTSVADVEAGDLLRVYVDAEHASAAPRPIGYFQRRYLEQLQAIEAEWAFEPEQPEVLEVEEPTDSVSPADTADDETPLDEAAQLDRIRAETLALSPDVKPGEPPDAETAERLLAERAAEFEPEDASEAPEGPSAWTRERVLGSAEDASLAGEDFSGLDLSGIDFTGRELDGCLFHGSDLAGAIFDGARLTGASLRGASLGGASFAGAWLLDADLTSVDGTDVVFASARMRRTCLAEANLTDAVFRAAILDDADFSSARLLGADFSSATLISTQFQQAELNGACLDGVKATDAVFADAVLTRATARGGDFFEADFSAASMANAVFDEANLKDVRLEGVNAPGLSLVGASATGLRAAEGSVLTGMRAGRLAAAGSYWETASLAGADFTEADLRQADFSHADLSHVCLDRVDAAGARFIAANLANASLRQINLFLGSLERASLGGSDLAGANCYGVEFLDAQHAEARLAGANLNMTKLEQDIRHG